MAGGNARRRMPRAVVTLSAAAAVVCAGAAARAATHTYTAPNTTNTSPGDAWSAGSNWDATPASGNTTTLIFNVPTTTGVSRFTNNDIAGNFVLNALTLQGSGPVGASATGQLTV